MRLHTFKRKREDVERPWTPVQLLLVGELGERSTTQRLVFRRFCESLADTFASESLYFVVLHEGFDVGSAIVHKSRVQRHDDDDLFSMPWKAKFDVLDENLAGARVYLFPDTLPMPLYRYVLGVQMQFPLQWSASINDQMTYYELCARTREYTSATFTSFERMNSGTVRLVCLACPTRGNIVPVNELLKGDWREANSWFTSWRCERHRPCLP